MLNPKKEKKLIFMSSLKAKGLHSYNYIIIKYSSLPELQEDKDFFTFLSVHAYDSMKSLMYAVILYKGNWSHETLEAQKLKDKWASIHYVTVLGTWTGWEKIGHENANTVPAFCLPARHLTPSGSDGAAQWPTDCAPSCSLCCLILASSYIMKTNKLFKKV